MQTEKSYSDEESSDEESSKEKELEQKEKELAQKEKELAQKEKELVQNEINAFDYKQKREEYVNVKFNKETKEIYDLLHDETFYRDFLNELLQSLTDNKAHFVCITHFLFITPIECIYRFIILLLYDRGKITGTLKLTIDVKSILNPILNIITTLKRIVGSSAINKIKGILEDTKTFGVGGIYNMAKNINDNDGTKIKPFLLKLIERVVYNIVNSFLDNNMIYEENLKQDIELFIPVLFGIGNFTGSLSVELNDNSEEIAKVVHHYLFKFYTYIIAIRDAKETDDQFNVYFPKYENSEKDETIEVISKFLHILIQIVYEAIEFVDDRADKYLNVKKDILLKESTVNTGANALAGVSNTVFKFVGSDVKISKNYNYINRMLSIIKFILCIVSQYTNNIKTDESIDCTTKEANSNNFILSVISNTFDKPRQLELYYGLDIAFLASRVSVIGVMNSEGKIDLINNTLKYEHTYIKKIAKRIQKATDQKSKSEQYKELINRYFITVIIFISQFLEQNKYMIALSDTEQITGVASKMANKGLTATASAVGDTTVYAFKKSKNLAKDLSRTPFPTNYINISSPFSTNNPTVNPTPKDNPKVNNPIVNTTPKVKTKGGKKTRKNKRRMITRKHRRINHNKTRCNIRKNSRKGNRSYI